MNDNKVTRIIISSGSEEWEGQDYALLLLSASYRVLILLVLRTTYVPDEYYQHVEPSFDVVYTRGIK